MPGAVRFEGPPLATCQAAERMTFNYQTRPLRYERVVASRLFSGTARIARRASLVQRLTTLTTTAQSS